MNVNELDSNMSTLFIEPSLICGSEDPQLRRQAPAPLLWGHTFNDEFFKNTAASWQLKRRDSSVDRQLFPNGR